MGFGVFDLISTETAVRMCLKNNCSETFVEILVKRR